MQPRYETSPHHHLESRPPQQQQQQQQQQQPPQQVIIHVHNLPQSKQNREWPQFKGKQSVWLGSFQIFFGVTSMICNSVGIHSYYGIIDSYEFNIFLIGVGCWAGIFFLTSGALAIDAAGDKTHRKLKSLLGMSIVSVILGVAQLGYASWLLADILSEHDLGDHFGQVKSAVAMAAMMVGAGVGMALTSMWLIFLSGDQLCGSGEPVSTQLDAADIIRSTNTTVPQSQSQFSGQTVQLPNGNIMMTQGGQYHNGPGTQTVFTTVTDGQIGKLNAGFTESACHL